MKWVHAFLNSTSQTRPVLNLVFGESTFCDDSTYAAHTLVSDSGKNTNYAKYITFIPSSVWSLVISQQCRHHFRNELRYYDNIIVAKFLEIKSTLILNSFSAPCRYDERSYKFNIDMLITFIRTNDLLF